MKILWFTWKDMKNSSAGGAEAVNENLAKKLAENGHEVIFLVAGFPGGSSEEQVSGYKIIRLGNKWTVYWEVYKYYKKNLIGWADLVIDEINTIPFFAKFYVKEKNIILSYQLCREIWFYQMFFPINIIGYLLEPLYLKLFNDRLVLTESESSKADFQNYGFNKNKIFVFPIGLEINPLNSLENIDKFEKPTILSFGSIRPMKRTHHIVEAFEKAKKSILDLKLIIAGDSSGAYGSKVINLIKNSEYSDSIEYLGRIDSNKKIELMQKSHLITAVSVKEGWGIIVTEANSQGTPAIVYDVDGLRDACKDDHTGIVTKKNSSEELSKGIIQLLKDKNLYERYRLNAWQDSFNYNYENSYKVFMDYIKVIIHE